MEEYQLEENFKRVYEEIEQACTRCGRSPSSVKLVTVTKTKPVELLQAVIDTGNYSIGENRVQDVIERIPLLKGKKEVHFVGHLQSNKVGKIIPYIDWIHSIDSVKILNKVDKYCKVFEKKVSILVQVNTSGEMSKDGCTPEEALSIVEEAISCENVNFAGLMTIGPRGGTDSDNRKSFTMLRELGEKCSQFTDRPIELSMGMSGDFALAIEEGATIIRVGSMIVGKRV